MFKSANGGRTGVRRVVILLTDGKNNGLPDVGTAANTLKTSPPVGSGATVISIGVGSGFNVNELKKIASQDSYVFTTNGFDQLSAILDSVVSAACQGMSIEI